MKPLTTFLLTAFITVAARAETVNFEAITANAPHRFDVAGQLTMDIKQNSLHEVSVLFKNVGSEASSISSIYFGTVEENYISLTIDSILSHSDNISFDLKTAKGPSGPPGYQDWHATLASAISQPPRSHNGIQPGESLELKLIYNSDASFMDLLKSGDIHVAMHVISIGEYSDTFINVPEPSSLILFGAAAAVIGFVRKRRLG